MYAMIESCSNGFLFSMLSVVEIPLTSPSQSSTFEEPPGNMHPADRALDGDTGPSLAHSSSCVLTGRSVLVNDILMGI